MERGGRARDGSPKGTIRALRDYLDNQRKAGTVDGEWVDRRDPGVPCPMPYIYVLIGDRFHLAPWQVEEAPADRFDFYLRLLSEEGRIKADLAGLEPDEEMFWEDDE